MSQSQTWDSVPLLALKCVFEHMELQDVLAAASTCRHWRSALLMYDGVRSCLKLQIHEDTTKHEMLARIFKKHLRRLHIYIGIEANEITLNNFTLHILPQFLDSINLQEVIFVGPIYMSQNKSTPYVQLRRVIFETLVYKHAHVLEKLAVFGCGINHLDEDDRYTSKHMAYYSKPLSFEALEYLSPLEKSILSRNTVNSMNYSNIRHIVFEYELISTEALITLSELDNLRILSLNIMTKKAMCLPQLDWVEVTPLFTKGLQVAVNIIALPSQRVKHVIDNAFRAGMPLTSLKVMFCNIFYIKLLHHITAMYNKTLEEFCWVDRPSRRDKQRRLKMLHGDLNPSFNYVNPFIYLAWQCKQLRKLTIHGYWMCEYDLIGITRLREDIDIDVSAVYDSRSDIDSQRERGALYRVMEPTTHTQYKMRVYQNIGGTVKNRNWSDLPAALRSHSSHKVCAEYIVSEVMHPLGVT